MSAAPPNLPPPPDDPEVQLRQEKLRLEITFIKRQLKIPELVKVLTGPVAVIGVVVTVVLGSLQLHQANQSRDDERFDKAITRLAASTPGERLSGIAGVELYLDPQQKIRHRPALRFLVGALASEPDPTVRGQSQLLSMQKRSPAAVQVQASGLNSPKLHSQSLPPLDASPLPRRRRFGAIFPANL